MSLVLGLCGAPWAEAVPVGLHLDGTDDYLSVSTSATLANKPFSVCYWQQYDGVITPFDGALSKTNGTTWSQGWLFYHATTTSIDFGIEGYATNFARANMTPTNLNHVCGTWDGTTISVYVNGVVGSVTDTYTSTMTTTNPMEIGRVGDDLYNLDGTIGDVRVYTIALTAAQVSALYASELTFYPDAPVAYWPLDDCAAGGSGDGVTFADRAGGGLAATGIDGANNTGFDCEGQGVLSYP